jgi:hypothetical protein
VTYNGYARDDGLWDIEAELRDVKTYDFHIPSQEPRAAGLPIHNLFIRLTVNDDMVVQDIATSMADFPHPECIQAPVNMHQMTGSTLGPGWRKAIERHVGGVLGCTHLREMLFNMATAAYQTIPSGMQYQRELDGVPEPVPEKPPLHVGKCMSWAFDGPVVERHYPFFWVRPP